MDSFDALANASRRRIVEILAERDRPAGELVAALPKLSQPAVSRHLKVLRNAGIATVTERGMERVYRLRREGLKPAEEWLARMRGPPVAAPRMSLE